jgi:hypothetical protein
MRENDSTPRSDRTSAFVPPIPGERMANQIEAASESHVDPDAELDSNELHVAGAVCVLCGKLIGAGSDVRKTVSGNYQHEVCPVL